MTHFFWGMDDFDFSWKWAILDFSGCFLFLLFFRSQVQNESGKLTPLSSTVSTSVSAMASALSALFAGDVHAKPRSDGSVSAATKDDLRFHTSAESPESSGKRTQKSDQWQPSMEGLESKRASKKHDEEGKRFLAHEANEIRKYSSFEDETTHPVLEKTGDYHKEAAYSFLRKGSMELFSSQPLFQPLERKEIDTIMQGKWEVTESHSFGERMDLKSGVKSKTLHRGAVYVLVVGVVWFSKEQCFCFTTSSFQVLSRLFCFYFLMLLKLVKAVVNMSHVLLGL